NSAISSRTFFSRVSNRPSTDGTSHLHERRERRERTNRPHLSRRRPEFMPTQTEPNDHVRKADGV
ncbi:hypothetical protein ACWDDN_36945, partial [Streptomyces griseoruber]